jgi:hypothetical protein
MGDMTGSASEEIFLIDGKRRFLTVSWEKDKGKSQFDGVFGLRHEFGMRNCWY